MDDDDRRRQEFWRTLLAMGFQGQAACTGAYSGVELDWRVFERGIYHTKAAELIMHFLLGRLDAVRVRREFFDCWPIGSPQQAREFRAKAFRWLDELRHDPAAGWPADVPVRRSYVDECRGARFEAVLWTLAFVSAHAQLRTLGRPLQAEPLQRGSGLVVEDAETVRRKLGSCRARYGRCTRDRSRAVEQWRAAEDALRQQIGAAEDGRQKAHAQYRACRKRLATACPLADVPAVDASAADVEQRLAALAGQAKRLWRDSAGWVEQHVDAVEMVDAVIECRANGVRLDARRDARLAPPPAMADAWAQWLDRNGPPPFRGADVSLHAVARMATACVGALRRSLAAPDTEPLLLNGAGSADVALSGGAERMRQLDLAITAQDARLARLRRLRGQLAEQRTRVAGQLVPRSSASEGSAVVGALLAGIRRPVDATCAAAVAADEGRATRLAAVWDELLGADAPPAHVVGAAWPGSQAMPHDTPRLSLSFMSDAGGLPFSLSKKRTVVAERPDPLKRLKLNDDDDDVPDFLVG